MPNTLTMIVAGKLEICQSQMALMALPLYLFFYFFFSFFRSTILVYWSLVRMTGWYFFRFMMGWNIKKNWRLLLRSYGIIFELNQINLKMDRHGIQLNVREIFFLHISNKNIINFKTIFNILE